MSAVRRRPARRRPQRHGHLAAERRHPDRLAELDFTHMMMGHGDVATKSHLAFFRGYMTDLIAAVKKADADGATLDEMKKTLSDQLAPKYEKGMSRYPLGQYRASIGINVEMVHKKVVKKA